VETAPAATGGTGFFLCDHDEILELARLCDGVRGLPLRARYTFCMAPVALDDPLVTAALARYARKYARCRRKADAVAATAAVATAAPAADSNAASRVDDGNEQAPHLAAVAAAVSEASLPQPKGVRVGLLVPSDPPSDPAELAELESAHAVFDLYIWLARRFPVEFNALEEAQAGAEATQRLIQAGLQRMGEDAVRRGQEARAAWVQSQAQQEALQRARHSQRLVAADHPRQGPALPPHLQQLYLRILGRPLPAPRYSMERYQDLAGGPPSDARVHEQDVHLSIAGLQRALAAARGAGPRKALLKRLHRMEKLRHRVGLALRTSTSGRLRRDHTHYLTGGVSRRAAEDIDDAEVPEGEDEDEEDHGDRHVDAAQSAYWRRMRQMRSTRE